MYEGYMQSYNESTGTLLLKPTLFKGEWKWSQY